METKFRIRLLLDVIPPRWLVLALGVPVLMALLPHVLGLDPELWLAASLVMVVACLFLLVFRMVLSMASQVRLERLRTERDQEASSAYLLMRLQEVSKNLGSRMDSLQKEQRKLQSVIDTVDRRMNQEFSSHRDETAKETGRLLSELETNKAALLQLREDHAGTLEYSKNLQVKLVGRLDELELEQEKSGLELESKAGALHDMVERLADSCKKQEEDFEGQLKKQEEDLEGQFKKLEKWLKRATDEVQDLDAGLNQRLGVVRDDLVCSNKKLGEMRNDLRGEIEETQQILSLSNVTNYQYLHVHPRGISLEDLQKFEDLWLPALNLDMSRHALGYLAHKICSLEDRCVGRLAASSQDTMLRVLLARSLEGKPLRVLEIGTLFGIAIAAIHENCRGFHSETCLSAIDPLDGFYQTGNDKFTGMPVAADLFHHNMQIAAVPQPDYQLVQHLSTDPQAFEQVKDRQFDILVIDGDHSYAGVKFDFETFGPLVRRDGLVLFDDYNQRHWPEVTQFVDEKVKGQRGWKLVGSDWHSIVFCRTGGHSKKKQPS